MHKFLILNQTPLNSSIFENGDEICALEITLFKVQLMQRFGG